MWDRFKLHIPMGIGEIIRKLAVARFSRTLGTLITSGVPILQAIEITGQAAGNVVIEDAMVDVQESVKEGQSITEPLTKVTVFPTMVTQMISVGEETGSLDAMLSQDRRLLRGRGQRGRQVADVDPRADPDARRRRDRGYRRHLDVPADLQHDEHRQVTPGARGVENEQLLAVYAETRSAATLDEIVRRNQNLLHHILKRFSYASEPYEDLLQVANLGLIKAAQRFDGGRGVRFSTYATAIVDGELRHHLRDSLLMRQPRWVKKVYQQIQDKSNELMHKLGRPPEVAELAKALNINEDGILEVMNLYSRIELHSQDEPFTSGELQAGADPHLVHSLRPTSFALPIEDKIALYAAMDRLSAFQKRLIYLLFFKDLTQSEVAQEMGLTQKKVSRESIKALGRLKEVLGRKVF